MFRLPEARPLLTLYGQESRDVFTTKPSALAQDPVDLQEDNTKIQQAAS
jgi:hypothetical protein